MPNQRLFDAPPVRPLDRDKYLKLRSCFHREATAIVDMSERTLDRLLHDLLENGGHLSHASREGEFKPLTDREVQRAQAIFVRLCDRDFGTHRGQK